MNWHVKSDRYKQTRRIFNISRLPRVGAACSGLPQITNIMMSHFTPTFCIFTCPDYKLYDSSDLPYISLCVLRTIEVYIVMCVLTQHPPSNFHFHTICFSLPSNIPLPLPLSLLPPPPFHPSLYPPSNSLYSLPALSFSPSFLHTLFFPPFTPY